MERKIAIVTDTVMEYGGAEKVLETFLGMFPKVHLYTLFIVPAARKKIFNKFPGLKIHTSIFQLFVKGNNPSKYISVIKMFSWLYWEILNLKEYDLVISSSHSYMSKNVKTGEGTLHLSYIHTPPRYLYDEFNEIGWIKKFPVNFIIWPVMAILRLIDKRGVMRPDILVANSDNVKKRIKKYYNREVEVVYPPVDGKDIVVKKSNYYVCVSRLVKQKGIDLAVRTCVKHKLPLVIIGEGGEMENLERISDRNVKFLGKVDDSEKWKVIAGAKALIYTSRDEDFGIVPVEALKAGVPVIAYNSGGVKETIKDGINGVFFNELTVNSLRRAIERFDTLKIDSFKCRSSAGKFSVDNFKKSILEIISNG